MDNRNPHFENYDPLYPDQPVVDQYLHVWGRHTAFAKKTAFRWVDMSGKVTHSLTFAQLNHIASLIATQLLEAYHLSHGDRVMALLPPNGMGLQFIELLFGSQRAGLVLIPIPISTPGFFSSSDQKDHVGILIERIKSLAPKLIIAPQEFRPILDNFQTACKYVSDNTMHFPTTANLSRTARIQGFLYESFDEPEDRKVISRVTGHRGCKSGDIYLLQYTSGTTGAPKPVLITAGAAAHNVRAARRAYGFEPTTVIASWLPLYHDCGLMLVLLSVVTGCSMVVTSPFYFVKRPMLWLEILSQYKATATAVPAFALPLTCAKFKHPTATTIWTLDLSALETLMIMNEPVLECTINDFLETFQTFGLKASAMAPSYGLAETCTFVCSSRDLDRGSPGGSIPTSGNIVASGKLSSNFEFDIRIVNPDTCVEVELGEEGEIWIASASKARSYFDDEKRTNRDLRAILKERAKYSNTNEISRRSSEYLRTGDLGRISDNYLFVTGRVDDIIQAYGRFWYPHEIERTVFETSTKLRSGCAVAFSFFPRQRVNGYTNFVVILAELATAVENEHNPHPNETLIKQIRSNVSSNHEGFEASVIGILPPRSIPKTTSGKLRRNYCRNLFLAHKFQFLDLSVSPPFSIGSAL